MGPQVFRPAVGRVTTTPKIEPKLAINKMKTQFIINAQTQFLRETIQFYNSSNRATGPKGIGCVYNETPTSPGCAIGRHVPNKKLCALWSESEGFPNGAFVCSLPKDLLGPLVALGVDFLDYVQQLHDRGFFWDAAGLSPLAEAFVCDTCRRFGLPVAQVLVDKPAENTN